MALRRRGGAPRLIKWTGERCVPWAPDTAVVYEHFHRYLWAARLTAGKRVLDLGSGEGFGAAILAKEASAVVGVDIDQPTVDHSNLNYEAPNLAFRLGSAHDLSAFEPASFDAVVSFEVIEHVDDQASVIGEITRVLAPDGLLIMSTPDRRAYSDATGQSNPFHKKELTLEEFGELLGARFPHVACWGQRTITGSRIDAVARETTTATPVGGDFFLAHRGDEWEEAARPAPLYLLALASAATLPCVPAASTLADFDLTLMRVSERQAHLASAEARRLSDEASAHAADAAASRAETERLRREARRAKAAPHTEEARAQLAEARGHFNRALEQHSRATQIQLEQDDARLAAAQERIAELTGQALALGDELSTVRMRVRRTEESVSWRGFQALRAKLYEGIGGERSAGARMLSWSLRVAGRAFQRQPPPPPPAPEVAAVADPGPRITFPSFDHPQVSLLIAIRARADLTEKCLASIRRRTIGVSYEVILLDDAADAQSKLLLDRIDGASRLVNERNLGFLRTINHGAEAARGKWLVVMNNDVEATDGWLNAMLDCAESGDDVGVVSPKYVYPDGRLQEAGALMWRDASGVNVGRNEGPDHCLYNYRREIDYGSGAALMVRASFWREVGGFDERFMPMYYEDADLCFQARERGLRVLYEPGAVVVHVEGATAGTDADPREKRHQDLNRPKFQRKWRHRLDHEHLRSDITNVRRAADRHPGPHVLIVDHRVATWDRDAGSQRMLGIITALQLEGAHVTFLPNNLAPIQPYTRELQRRGVAVLYGAIALREELATIGARLSLVVLSRPHPASAWLDTLRELAPAARVVYDTVDLHWLREARRAGVSPESSPLPPKAFALRELELALIRATDETWVVTDDEAARVTADAPGAKTRVVSLIHDVAAYVPPPESRSGLLFVGGFEHPPNIDAVTRLVRDVMPLVWAELGDVRVSIVGPNPPAEIRLLAAPLVDITGWVADLDPLLRSSRLLVAPLQYGAGLKGKVTQALAAGLPVVTTPIGAEGLEAARNEHILVGGDAIELARLVIVAYCDDDLWERLSQGGQDFVGQRCSTEVVGEQLRAVLAECSVGARPRTAVG